MTASHERRTAILRWIIGFMLVSTVLHYTHNFVEIDQYPRSGFVSNDVVLLAILLSLPVLTAIGFAGYRHYTQRRYKQAHACLIAYSFAGWLTLGHFTAGNPDIAPFWYATIFTDAIGAAALTAFVVWSARSVEADQTAAPA